MKRVYPRFNFECTLDSTGGEREQKKILKKPVINGLFKDGTSKKERRKKERL